MGDKEPPDRGPSPLLFMVVAASFIPQRKDRKLVRSTFRKLLGIEKRRARRLKAQFRLHLEALQDRVVPSTLHVGAAPGEFPQIQQAVLAANSGDTIRVDPGTYNEQVTIFQNSHGVTLNNLVLEGSNQSSIIQLPSTAPASQQTAIVKVSGASNVTIDEFTIQGPGNGPGSIGYGVQVVGGGSANITNNHITQIQDGPMSGDQNGVAILVGRKSLDTTGTATISHNTIDGYQKAGIVVDNVGSSAEIDHNTISGAGSTALIAQNGIQISRGATANVNHNTVSGNLYAPQSDASTGILLYQSGAVTVEQNTLLNNDIGIDAIAANGSKIDHNQVTASTFDGIVLDSTTGATLDHNTMSYNGFGDSSSNPTADAGIALVNAKNNTITQNTSNSNKGDGICVDAASTGNSFAQNQTSGNTNFGVEDDSTGTGTAGTANTWAKTKGQESSPSGLVS
jgi:parallel beta-helix repeat protein